MKLTLDSADERYQIQAFKPGEITVNHQPYQDSLIVCSDRLIPEWPVSAIEELSETHLAPLADLQVEIVLLGTGARLRFPHPSITGSLAECGIGVEIMDAAAACRTYNVLLSEGRAVAAALIIE